ncbi:uncharacterized protein LOC117812578 [Xyrichtys novacula]|nr:uncharacterized protein LOC117812578 [Xyrichtys novacula]
MNTFLFLMCSVMILGAPLCKAQSTADPGTSGSDEVVTDLLDVSTGDPSYVSSVGSTTAVNSLLSTRSPTTVSKSHSTSSSDGSTLPNSSSGLFFNEECLLVYMVAGGLILVCFILLLSTLLLACRVCRLSRRVKELSSNEDLVSTVEYRMGTDKKNKSKPENEPEETAVLMSDLSHTKEEMGNGNTKEEGEKEVKDGQTGDESKTEGGEANKNEEAAASPATAAESSTPSKGQEETSEFPSADEGAEEPKDVV